MKNFALILLAVLLSAYIGYSDLHQTDTPITVAALLAASFLVGLFVTRHAWAYGVIIGLGVPVAGFIAAYNHWTLTGLEHGQTITWQASYTNSSVAVFAIVVGLAGVYTAQIFRRLFIPQRVS